MSNYFYCMAIRFPHCIAKKQAHFALHANWHQWLRTDTANSLSQPLTRAKECSGCQQKVYFQQYIGNLVCMLYISKSDGRETGGNFGLRWYCNVYLIYRGAFHTCRNDLHKKRVRAHQPCCKIYLSFFNDDYVLFPQITTRFFLLLFQLPVIAPF